MCFSDVPLINTPVIKGYNKSGKRRRRRAAGTVGARCSWTVKDNPIVPGSTPAKYQVQWVRNGKIKPAVDLGSNARSADLECKADNFKAGDNVMFQISFVVLPNTSHFIYFFTIDYQMKIYSCQGKTFDVTYNIGNR